MGGLATFAERLKLGRLHRATKCPSQLQPELLANCKRKYILNARRLTDEVFVDNVVFSPEFVLCALDGALMLANIAPSSDALCY